MERGYRPVPRENTGIKKILGDLGVDKVGEDFWWVRVDEKGTNYLGPVWSVSAICAILVGGVGKIGV